MPTKTYWENSEELATLVKKATTLKLFLREITGYIIVDKYYLITAIQNEEPYQRVGGYIIYDTKKQVCYIYINKNEPQR